MIKTDKKIQEVKGIHCEAENCLYHSGDCKCMAGSINVGCHDASCSDETVCATFKPDDGEDCGCGHCGIDL